MTTTIRLQREAFDVATETARMTRGRTDIGAVVTFTGLCRADICPPARHPRRFGGDVEGNALKTYGRGHSGFCFR